MKPAATVTVTAATAAVARLTASRLRLRQVLVDRPPPTSLAPWLRELVQGHPWASVSVALLLGALAARARPWRWLQQPGLWRVLLPSLLPSLASLLATLPVSGLSTLLAAWLQRAAASPPAPADTPATG